MKITTAFVVRAIAFCWRNAWLVIAAAFVLALASSWYAATHFKMTTNMNQLISSNLPWRINEAALEKAFPHFQLIVAVIDAPTPELVTAASNALVARLEQRKDMFQAVTPLANAANDARAMDRVLRDAGFATTLKVNAKRRELHQLVHGVAAPSRRC